MMASLANGGSADDIARASTSSSKLKNGRQLPAGRPDPGDHRVRPDPGRHRLGLPERRADRQASGKIDWKVVVPTNAVVGGYYVQAINKDAPHPAAARLWQEFLYSDEGQNLWLKGGARPVRLDAMKTAGTLDKAAVGALPPVDGHAGRLDRGRRPTQAKDYLAANWANAVG